MPCPAQGWCPLTAVLRGQQSWEPEHCGGKGKGAQVIAVVLCAIFFPPKEKEKHIKF